MKKGVLLNSELSYVISKMGHTDGLTIGDAGLPIPDEVKRIDLALTKNIPSFLDTLEVVLAELRVEEIIIATEMKAKSPQLYHKLLAILENQEKKENITIEIIEVAHEEFKAMTSKTKAAVRTGEETPYANIILKSGVVF